MTDKIEVKLLADGGPEFGVITLILVDRLLVRLIKEPFDSPAEAWKKIKRTKRLRGRN